MYTLDFFQKSIQSYIDELKNINTTSQSEFETLINQAKNKFIEKMLSFRDSYAGQIFINYSPNMSKEQASHIFECLSQEVEDRYTITNVNDLEVLVDTIQHETIVTPTYLPELSSYNIIKILEQKKKEEVTHFLLNLLMSLPIKQIRLTLVDLGGSFVADYLYKNINPILYNQKPITDIYDLKGYLKKANERVLRNVQKYGSICDFNIKHKCVAEPYEIIVLLDNLDATSISPYKDCKLELDSLKRNCAKGGIYIVDFVSSDLLGADSERYDVPKSIIQVNLISEIPNLLLAATDYINKAASQVTSTMLVKLDVSNILSEYAKSSEEISIPIGKEGFNDIYFKLDIVGHVHTFILGQSGSGKSVFLHDVIVGAMLKYAPEDLELYLLDFKIGGVEFNRYKGEKHVHAMLVDNSDQQVTLEILRELHERMLERGKLLRTSESTNIKEYNQSHPNNKMSSILFIVDECHEMFKVDESIPRSITNEINEIVSKIAKEGRNQGVHLIMATQTLSGAEIGNEILNNTYFTIVCMVVIAVFCAIIMNSTIFGYELKAIQGNQLVARNSGINVFRNAVICYTLAGGLVCIGGMFDAAYTTQMTANLGLSSNGAVTTNMFPMMLGAFIGALSNDAVGTITASLTIQIFMYGLTQLEFSTPNQNAISQTVFVLFLIYLANKDLFKLRKREKARIQEAKARRAELGI